MRHLVAVLEQDHDAEVLATAASVADLLDAEVVALPVDAGEESDRLERIRQAVAQGEVVAAAISTSGSDPLLFRNMLTEVSVPVVVVPDGDSRRGQRISRVLVPLDGSPRTSASVRDLERRAVASGAEVVAVHVFDDETVPPFWDQAAHTPGTWTREFLERNVPQGVQLDLRRGRPADEVLAHIQHAGVDLVVLVWSQNLSEGRARTVRRTIAEGGVPVLLVPCD